jgi:5-methylcytosine-specific restriction endonuclease McrA
MWRYTLSHLADPTLLRGLTGLVAQDCTTTADLLAHIAEVDARKLYLPTAYPSMFSFCVGELRMSEDMASKRIQAARVARRFPAIFDAVAEGRLHLSAVVLLAPHLEPDTANELLAAATHKTKADIERLLAERFPRPDMLAWVGEVPVCSTTPSVEQHAPGHVENRLSPGKAAAQPVSEPVAASQAPVHAGDRPKVRPLGSQLFAVQFSLSRSAHDKLRYAQGLLGHQVPSGDIAQVFERALDALIPQLEKQKFAATARPRRSQRPSANPRHIPAEVKRAVWERDEGQCTFVGPAGKRCPARTRLEFDHIQEVARGGRASVAGIRLCCRAHNQYEAERTFGTEFMHQKREAARHAAEARRRKSEAREAAEARAAQARAKAAAEEVIAPLRSLGFRADEARRAAALCKAMPEASLEQRVRRALSYFHPRPRTFARAMTSPEGARLVSPGLGPN